MEKVYEKPEVQVVRYRRKVKTAATEEFTDSAGVQQLRVSCLYCGELLFTVPTEEADDPRYGNMIEAHYRSAHPDL